MPRCGRNGFTYLCMLFLLAILAVTATANLSLEAVMQRRAAEEELFRIGAEYRAAILSFLRSSPTGAVRYPAPLQELVRGPRQSFALRHLRQISGTCLTLFSPENAPRRKHAPIWRKKTELRGIETSGGVP